MPYFILYLLLFLVCYIFGLTIGWSWRIIRWLVILIVSVSWWLFKIVGICLLCGIAFCGGYMWSYLRSKWQQFHPNNP